MPSWFTGATGRGRADHHRGRGDRVPPRRDTSRAVPRSEEPGLAAIAVGPDGALWGVDNAGKIDRISTTGVVTQFSIPLNGETFGGIAAGPDGNLWFTENEGCDPAGPAGCRGRDHPDRRDDAP